MGKNIINTLASQNIESTQKLIDEGLNLSDINLSEIMAEVLNNEEIELNQNYLKFLIKNGIDINSQTKKGYTPLMMSIIKNLDEITYLLLEKDVDIHKVTLKGMNAILWAVSMGKYDLVRNLFDRGADIYQKINLEVEYTKEKLSMEDRLKNLKKLGNGESLSTKNKFIKKSNLSAFALAFNNYNKNIVSLLLELGFDPNENVLINSRIPSILNKDSIDAWNIENISMYYIINENDTETFHLLIEKGFNKFDSQSLINACENLNFEMIKVLIQKGVDVNEFDSIGFESPIMCVCRLEFDSIYQIEENELQYNILKYLINNGANVNNIYNPIYEFCKVSDYININPKVVQLFIENGADINCKDKNDKTLLMEVCDGKLNSYEIAKILIDNNANINLKDKNENSVLMYLNENGMSEELNSNRILELLLKKGININSKNNIGMTPLMKYSLEGKDYLVKILLENGADINLKSEMTAFDLAQNDEIKALIQNSKNNYPQKLVKILTNFTIDKPIKYTTHTWDFGELKKEYGNFDGYMNAVKNQFDTLKYELEELSPNLYKKIYTFLIEENPDEKYSWCNKTPINIGWSSLDGLKEHCNSGDNPFDFKLQKPIFIGRKQLATFGEVINLFKQEIEIRADFKNLEQIFLSQNIQLDLSVAKLNTRQFYTDTEKFSSVLIKIFDEMKKREDFKNIKVTTTELDDRSIEIKIIQIDSFANKNANDMFEEVNNGDFADIKESLKNLCDWSIESSFEDENFRVNFLHSNNVKDIEILETKPLGFTHILRFYK